MFSDRSQVSEIKSFRRQESIARGNLSWQSKLFCLSLAVLCLFSGASCRRDMQDQPRYDVYERDVAGGAASRTPPENTVPRGFLREDRQFYTGKTGNANTGGAMTTGTTGPAAGTGGGNSANMNGGGMNTGGGGQQNTNANGQNAGTGGASGTVATTTDVNNVTEFPFPVTAEVVNRGQERYNIFCSMCHGATGAGDGMVVRRGYRRPPLYQEDRLREERVGHFFDVITNGWGTMPSYANQIPPADRWAIVAYIRALQISGGASLAAGGTTQGTVTGGNGGAAQTSPAQSSPQAGTPASGGQTEGGTRR